MFKKQLLFLPIFFLCFFGALELFKLGFEHEFKREDLIYLFIALCSSLTNAFIPFLVKKLFKSKVSVGG